jgi:hypothetical protein
VGAAMNLKNTILIVALCVLTEGCIFRLPGHYYGPPPTRTMNYDDATGLALGECRSRGLDCRVKEAHLQGNGIWKVHLRGYGNGRAGNIKYEYDAHNWNLLRTDEKIHPWKVGHPPRWDYDRDWEGDHDHDHDSGEHHATPPGHSKDDDDHDHGKGHDKKDKDKD